MNQKLIPTGLLLLLVFAVPSVAQTYSQEATTADQQIAASVYALHAMHRSQTRLVTELPFQTYAPIYQIHVTGQAGDVLRIAGHIVLREEDEQKNKAWTYLSVRRAFSPQTPTRVSSFAWQVVRRGGNQNHYTSMNLFGDYKVPSNGHYVIELMARKFDTSDSRVLVEWVKTCDTLSNRPLPPECIADGDPSDADALPTCTDETRPDCNPVTYSSNWGQVIVEQYRSYGSVQAAVNARAKLLVDTARAPFAEETVVVDPEHGNSECTHSEPKIYHLLPRTKAFDLDTGDILRVQSSATAQFDDDIELFALHLLIGNTASASQCTRLSAAEENLTHFLHRFNLQNDGMYRANARKSVFAFQEASNHLHHSLRINGGANTDVVAMHFASASHGAYLAQTRKLTATSDRTFSTSDPVIELFRSTDNHRAGDVLRVQSQLQLEMMTGNVGAACWARVEIYENGVLRYRSIFDQRFIQNSTDAALDHDSGAFSPFAVYETRQSGQHQVRLIADCNATSAATMRAKYYGRHLTVDRFTRS